MKFSVIIPTRNRSRFLGHAMTSALSQTHDDFEVIVSNNDSSDDTEAVVSRFQDPRVRYFRTEGAMSMPDHWNFALDKASGEWTLFLCDDDALTSDCLASLDTLIDNHPGISIFWYDHEKYYYDDGVNLHSNALKFRYPRPSTTEVVDSRAELRRAFQKLGSRVWWKNHMPKFLNSAVHRGLIDTIRNRHGRVFHHWAPDTSSGTLLLGLTDRFVVVHKPLGIWGKSITSYGPGAAVNPAYLLEFLNEFREFDGRLPLSPYPELITIHNMIYDTLARARELLDEQTRRELTINPWLHRQALLRDAQLYVSRGHDTFREAVHMLKRELRAMPMSCRCDLAAGTMSRRIRRWKTVLRGKKPRTKRLSGGETGAGFGNIAEAAHFYSRNVRSAG